MTEMVSTHFLLGEGNRKCISQRNVTKKKKKSLKHISLFFVPSDQILALLPTYSNTTPASQKVATQTLLFLSLTERKIGGWGSETAFGSITEVITDLKTKRDSLKQLCPRPVKWRSGFCVCNMCVWVCVCCWCDDRMVGKNKKDMGKKSGGRKGKQFKREGRSRE